MDEIKSGETRESEAADSPPPPAAPLASFNRELVPPSAFERRVQHMFIGPDGLRPLWRLVLYFALYWALHLGLGFFLYSASPSLGSLRLATVAEFGLTVIAIAPAILMARIEQRPFASYGLPLRHAFGKLFWTGAAWGLGTLSLLLLTLRLAGVFELGPLALHGARLVKFAAFWGAFFLVVAFYEEFLVRGYSLFTLTQAAGFWRSGILLSLAFGLLHLGNPGETWVGILGAIAIGLFFCLTLRRTGNLWFAIGFHTSWDWGQSYLYSVPDSGGLAPGHLLHSSLRGPPWLTGGTVGPEGSVFLFLLLALIWVIFDRMYPQVNYPAAISESRS